MHDDILQNLLPTALYDKLACLGGLISRFEKVIQFQYIRVIPLTQHREQLHEAFAGRVDLQEIRIRSDALEAEQIPEGTHDAGHVGRDEVGHDDALGHVGGVFGDLELGAVPA